MFIQFDLDSSCRLSFHLSSETKKYMQSTSRTTWELGLWFAAIFCNTCLWKLDFGQLKMSIEDNTYINLLTHTKSKSLRNIMFVYILAPFWKLPFCLQPTRFARCGLSTCASLQLAATGCGSRWRDCGCGAGETLGATQDGGGSNRTGAPWCSDDLKTPPPKATNVSVTRVSWIFVLKFPEWERLDIWRFSAFWDSRPKVKLLFKGWAIKDDAANIF